MKFTLKFPERDHLVQHPQMFESQNTLRTLLFGQFIAKIKTEFQKLS